MRLSHIFNWLFPPLCVHCQSEGAWVCPIATTILNAEPILVDTLHLPGIDRVFIRGSYDCQPLAQVIQRLKYHYWTAMAPDLDRVVRPLVDQVKLPAAPVIVPVPLHPRRNRQRGFNQSWLIGNVLRQQLGCTIEPLLQRTRYTRPQAQLSANDRCSNIVGAISARQVAKWPNSVILVDDVITTGSTIVECASVLRHHGVQHIIAVALAKG